MFQKKTMFSAAGVLGMLLVLDAFLPPDRQPSAQALGGLIRVYQIAIAPVGKVLGVQCRYEPSCSNYALQAIRRSGTWPGLGRTLGRLVRCSPWGGCGFDPVPEGDSGDDHRWAPGEWMRARHDDGAGMMACTLGCLVLGALSGLALFIAVIFILVWVHNDAKARGDQNPALWVLIVLFSHLVMGLILYLIVRPKGVLAPCSRCRTGKLETLVRCPHCGADSSSTKSTPA